MDTLKTALTAFSRLFVALLMALGLTAGLAACGGGEEAEMEDTEQTEDAAVQDGEMEDEDDDEEEEDGGEYEGEDGGEED